jgi:hypothetical protein
MPSEKLICFVICSILATAPARAASACEPKLAACLEALSARELQVEDYRSLSAEQKAYIAGLKLQRGEAVELAKDNATPWLGPELVFIGGVVAGAALMYGAARLAGVMR